MSGRVRSESECVSECVSERALASDPQSAVATTKSTL